MSLLNDLENMRAVGASDEEIQKYRQNKILDMQAVGMSDTQIQEELGQKKIDNTTQKSFWNEIEKVRPLTPYEAKEKKYINKLYSNQDFMPELEYTPAGPRLNNDTQFLVDDLERKTEFSTQGKIDNKLEFGRYFTRGLGMSNFNLMKEYFTNGSLPEGYSPDFTQPSRFERVTQQIGNILADLPIYGATAYLAGKVEKGKTKGLAPLYAAGFVNGAIRESFIQALERGDVDTWGQWWDIFTHHSIDAGNKEGLTLAGSVGLGQAAKYGATKALANPKLNKFGLPRELAAIPEYLATVGGFNIIGGLLEGEMPTKDEVIDSFFVVGALMAGARGASYGIERYKQKIRESDKPPHETIIDIEKSKITKEDIVSKNNLDRTNNFIQSQERLVELKNKLDAGKIEYKESKELKFLEDLQAEQRIPGSKDTNLTPDTFNSIPLTELLNEGFYNKRKVRSILEEEALIKNHPEIKKLERDANAIQRTEILAEQRGQYSKETGFAEAWQIENNWKTVVEELSNRTNAPKNKQAIILLGGAATGKTSYANRINQGKEKYETIDPDIVKEHPQFAETYQGGKGANALHLESKAIAAKILNNVVSQGKNFIYPMVGSGGSGKMQQILSILQNKGYDINIALLEIPKSEATYRALKRSLETGRYVPLDYVQNASKFSEINYEYAKTAKEVVEAKRIDTSTGQPKVTESKSSESVRDDAGARRDGSRPSDQGVEPVTIQDRISFEPPPEPGFNVTKFRNDLVKDYIDKLHPILLAVRRTEQGKVQGGELNVYEQQRIQPGMVGRAEHFINTGTLKLADLSLVGKGLFDILSPLKNITQYKAFSEYAVAKRVLELSQRGIETGVDITKARQVVKNGKEQFESIFREINQYNIELLNYLRDAGIINQKSYKVMLEANKDYVPFGRVMEEGNVGGSIGKSVSNPLKKIKGSERTIIDPIESIFKNTYHFVTLAERNIANRNFIDFTQKYKSEFPEVSKVTGKGKAIQIKKGELDNVLSDAAKADIATLDNLTIFRRDGQKATDTQIVVFRNGKKEIWEVGREYAEVINGANASAASALVKFMAIPARWLRSGSTLAPDFFMRNLLRDTSTAGIFTKSGKGIGGLPIITTLRGLTYMVLGRNKKNADSVIRDFEKSGAMQSMLVSFDRKYFDKKIQNELYNTPVRNLIKSPLESLRILSELAEQTTRVAEFNSAYKKAKSQGLSERDALQRAGFEGRDITIDFAKIGAKMQATNMIVAFINARVQGYAKLFESFRDQPLTTSARIFTQIMLPSALLWYVNKDDPVYKALPRWQKDLFYIVIVGEGDDATVYRIPKPFELGVVFGTGTEKLLDFITKRSESEDIAQFVGDLLEDNAKGMLPIPQILLPFVENYFNKSLFTGQAIVPRGTENILPEYQFTPYTSQISKALGSIIAEIDPTTPFASPARIDALIRGWTGTLGNYAVQIADAALIKSGIIEDPVKPTKTLADIPFIKAFVVRNPSSGSEFIEKFYELYGPMAQATATVQEVQDPQAKIDVLNYIQDDLGVETLGLEGTAKALANIRKYIAAVYNNKSISPDEKRELIDDSYRMMIEMAKNAVEAFDK